MKRLAAIFALSLAAAALAQTPYDEPTGSPQDFVPDNRPRKKRRPPSELERELSQPAASETSREAPRRRRADSGNVPVESPRRRGSQDYGGATLEREGDENAEAPVDEGEGKVTGTALTLFFGIYGGYTSLTAPDLGFQDPLTGYSMGGSATLGVYQSRFALDFGAGWLYSKQKGEQTVISGGTTTVTKTEITTQSGFAQFSPRFRVGEYFEIGPYAQFLFGLSNPFSQSTTAKEPFPILAGLRLGASIRDKGFHFRVFADIGTDLTLPQRTVFTTLLNFEFGVPLISGKTVVKRETKVVEKVVVQEVVKFVMEDQLINFEFGKADLTAASADYATRVGRYLSQNPDLWARVRVDGHTDNRGSDEYNDKLSLDRAESVKAAFVRSGVPAERITVRGLGKRRPLVNGETEEAYARNRRVELVFNGVAKPQRFRDELNGIRLKTLKPKL